MPFWNCDERRKTYSWASPSPTQTNLLTQNPKWVLSKPQSGALVGGKGMEAWGVNGCYSSHVSASLKCLLWRAEIPVVVERPSMEVRGWQESQPRHLLILHNFLDPPLRPSFLLYVTGLMVPGLHLMVFNSCSICFCDELIVWVKGMGSSANIKQKPLMWPRPQQPCLLPPYSSLKPGPLWFFTPSHSDFNL